MIYRPPYVLLPLALQTLAVNSAGTCFRKTGSTWLVNGLNFQVFLFYSFTRSAVTKWHKLGGSNNRNLSLTVVEAGSEVKRPARLVSSRALRGKTCARILSLAFRWPAFLLCLRIVSLSMYLCPNSHFLLDWGQSCSFGPTLRPSF